MFGYYVGLFIQLYMVNIQGQCKKLLGKDYPSSQKKRLRW